MLVQRLVHPIVARQGDRVGSSCVGDRADLVNVSNTGDETSNHQPSSRSKEAAVDLYTLHPDCAAGGQSNRTILIEVAMMQTSVAASIMPTKDILDVNSNLRRHTFTRKRKHS